MAQCQGRRPQSGQRCTNLIPKGSRAFCQRCDSEVFKQKSNLPAISDKDKPNTYEPEPVEATFLPSEKELGYE